MKNTTDRRSLVISSLALAAASVCAPSTASTSPAGSRKYNVVFQVSDADPGKWQLTLANIRNAQAELGSDNVHIELVAFGPGIGMLKRGSEAAARVAEAAKAAVKVYACENTMRALKLTPAQMVEEAEYVPSGVAHVIRKQVEGFAYIRS